LYGLLVPDLQAHLIDYMVKQINRAATAQIKLVILFITYTHTQAGGVVGSRRRAPFNPKSGQQGDGAAPRSCKPQSLSQAKHQATHDSSHPLFQINPPGDEIGLVGTMNGQLYQPSERAFHWNDRSSASNPTIRQTKDQAQEKPEICKNTIN